MPTIVGVIDCSLRLLPLPHPPDDRANMIRTTMMIRSVEFSIAVSSASTRTSWNHRGLMHRLFSERPVSCSGWDIRPQKLVFFSRPFFPRETSVAGSDAAQWSRMNAQMMRCP